MWWVDIAKIIGAIIVVMGALIVVATFGSSLGEGVSVMGSLLGLVGMSMLFLASATYVEIEDRQSRSFQLVKAGFVNPVPNYDGDFGVSVPGIPSRVKLLSDNDKFYVVDLSGDEREVKTPADVREIVDK